MKHGKKYVDSAKLIDRAKLYDAEEALDVCIKTAKAKFDETVEAHINWVLTAVMLTSRSAALSCCLMVPVKTSVYWRSARATMWKRPRLPVLSS